MALNNTHTYSWLDVNP